MTYSKDDSGSGNLHNHLRYVHPDEYKKGSSIHKKTRAVKPKRKQHETDDEDSESPEDDEFLNMLLG